LWSYVQKQNIPLFFWTRCRIRLLFLIWPIHHHRYGILQRHTEFYPKWSMRGTVMTSYRFFKMAIGSHVEFCEDNVTPPMKCSCGSELGLQIWSRIMFIVSGILPFKDFGILPWNCLFAWHAQSQGLIYFWGWNHLHTWIQGDSYLPIQHSTSTGTAFHIRGVMNPVY